MKDFFCSSCSIDEWDDCEYTDTIDAWDRVTLGTNFKGVNEIYHLEDDQTHISTNYDHISNLIQVGTKSKFVVPKSLQSFTFKEILFMLHARPFLINVLLTQPISFHGLDICSGFPKK